MFHQTITKIIVLNAQNLNKMIGEKLSPISQILLRNYCSEPPAPRKKEKETVKTHPTIFPMSQKDIMKCESVTNCCEFTENTCKPPDLAECKTLPLLVECPEAPEPAYICEREQKKKKK